MHISERSIRRPVTTLMVYLAALIVGYFSLQKLSVNFLPDISTPRLTIQTRYGDALPDEIVRLITEPVEETVGTLSGVRRVRSVSREGVSLVQVDFYWGTSMEYALIDAREKLDRLKASLPKDAERPTLLRVDPSSEPILTLVVTETPSSLPNSSLSGESQSSRTSSVYEAAELCETLIKRRLEQVEGVAQAAVVGSPVREIQAEIDMPSMHAYGLTLSEVSTALASQNVVIPSGTIKDGDFRYALRTESRLRSLSDIEQAFVGKTEDERVILFKDIAHLTDRFAEPTAVTLFNGQECIQLHIRKEAAANTVAVSGRVKAAVASLKGELGKYDILVVFDQAEFIQRSIDDLVGSITVGALLAFITLFFFLNKLRYSFIIAVTTPMAIVTTFILMYAFGVSLNLISLTGIALGIGMLGDNAILVVENISRLQDEGLETVSAIIAGTKEINLAAAASTLTNVAIFLPVIFTDGIAREIFRDMGLAMTFSLLSALVISITLVPMLLSLKLFPSPKPQTLYSDDLTQTVHSAESRSAEKQKSGSRFSVVFLHDALRRMQRLSQVVLSGRLAAQRSVQQGYERGLRLILKYRKTVLTLSLGVFLVSLAAGRWIRTEVVPPISQRRFVLTLRFPTGYAIEATVAAVKQLTADLRRLPAVETLVTRIGRSAADDAVFSLENVQGSDAAEIDVQLRQGANEPAALEALRTALSQQPASMQVAVRRKATTLERLFRPEKDDLKLKLISQDLAPALRAAERVKALIDTLDGIADVRSGVEQTKAEYLITPDRPALLRYGIEINSLLKFIEVEARGLVVTEVRDGGAKTALRLVGDTDSRTSQRHTLETLLSKRIKTRSGFVPVRTLVSAVPSQGRTEIFRENSQEQLVLLANAAEGVSATALAQEIASKVDAAEILPAGVRLDIGGENEEVYASFKSLIVILMLSLALVYMILAAEFESVIYPLVIMLTSPLALVGALFAMLLFEQTLNAMSLIGLVIMVGAVDNDAVVATDFIIELRRQGLGLTEAIYTGISKRLRSIVMTTVTTVIGIVPLIFSIGNGSELGAALTVPIVGGLISATLFTLTTIPVVYFYLDRE